VKADEMASTASTVLTAEPPQGQTFMKAVRTLMGL
jgi:hypothetical protein